MGNRSTSRTKMVLPLRIWGRDTLGRQFVQLAHSLDLSASGVRVAGFRTAVRVGETVSVQYRHSKAQFRVAWVGVPGSSRENQVGIEYLEKEKRIFGLDMRDDSYTDDYEAPTIQDTVEHYSKARSYTRYPVSGSAEVRTAHAHKGNWGSLVDLSMGGCYVQTSSPLPLNTRTRVRIKLGGEDLEVWGGVRTCHNDVGMGIEFTDAVSQADAERLRGLIARLEAGEELSAAAIPKLNPDKFIERFKTAIAELTEMDEMLKELGPHADVLRHYRTSIGQLRTSAWALQRWFEMQEFGLDTAPVFAFLQSDRVRLSVQFCHELSRRLRTGQGRLDQDESAQLLRAVESVFAQLTGFSMSGDAAIELEPEPEPQPGPELDLPPLRSRGVAAAASVPISRLEEARTAEPAKIEGIKQQAPAEDSIAAVTSSNGAGEPIEAATSSDDVAAAVETSADSQASKRARKKKPEKRTRWKKV